MDIHPITENCRITPEIQNLLSRKRMSLGLSYRMLGEYFHLSWSTFRKWECGDSSEMKCRRFHLKTLNSYLNGEHDDRLKSLADPMDDLVSSWKKLPSQVHQCMERITTTYELCQGRPELRRCLVQSIEKASKDALRELLAREA